MTIQCPPVAEKGLQFFGKLSASVSHDLKNVLSTINESAGLLEDFCLMSQKGMAIDLNRIGTVAGKIKGQVNRADLFLTSFNLFAHSVDRTVYPADLGEVVTTLNQLAEGSLACWEILTEVRLPDEPVVITTRPLLVQILIWSGIEWARPFLGNKRRMVLSVESCRGGAVVMIGPLENLPNEGDELQPCLSERGIQDALKAKCRFDQSSGHLSLEFSSLESPDEA
jgi:light-regulated signal transduction histidine kinase (bacteriophytochrome)